MTHRIELAWPGGVHVFALPIGRLRAVQTDCDAGPAWILQQIVMGQWRIDQLISVLRHGLAGGGMPDAEARDLVMKMVDLHPWARFVETAHRVILAAIVGVEEDPVGEAAGEPPGAPPPRDLPTAADA